MKKIYLPKLLSRIFSLIPGALLLLAMSISQAGFSQQTYTFTNCGATGSVGPSQAMVNTSYTNTNLSGSVTATSSGIQQWTVPVTGGYRIDARGGQGGGVTGGFGANMAGDFTLTAGQVVSILVGQVGETFTSDRNIGGGGGSYVVVGSNTILVIAGGGGAARTTYSTANGATTTAGRDGEISTNTAQGLGGTSGSGGGGAGCRGGGGAGWSTPGAPGGCSAPAGNGGTVFVNGGYGGSITSAGASGGFGGGGSAEGTNNAWTYSGGGGGYSGGGGASNGDVTTPRGGGGGSINNGVNQLNTVSTATGHGRVLITELCPLSLTSSGSNSLAPLICSGSTLTLTTNGISNYSWSTGNTTSSFVVVSPTVTTTYSVSATSTAACYTSAFINVTVSSGIPVLSIATTTNNICLGQSVTFTASGALTYSWSGGISNGAPFTPSVNGTYTVSGANGCGTGTASASVSISPMPVTAISSSSAVCAGSTATLTAVSAGTSYTWLPTSASGFSVSVSPQVNTIYTVTASDGTCTGMTTVALNALPVPTITSASSSSNICAGLTVTLSANGASSYTWTPGNLSGPVVTVSPTQPTAYYVVATNSLGCTASSIQPVIVSPAPTVNISSNSLFICSGESVTLTVNGADTYLWNSNATTTAVVVSPLQQTTYSVTGTSSTTGCNAANTIVVDVFTPTISVTGNTAICSGATASIQASGAASYTWSTGSPFPGISVTPTVTTIYTVAAISTLSTLNCPVAGSIQVTVNQLPNVTLVSSRNEMCRNESVNVTASGAGTYSWNTSSATGASISLTSTLITTLLVTVNGTDANGCSNTASLSIKVNGCVGLESYAINDRQLLVYPNPSAAEFNIVYTTAASLVIVNETGQLVRELELNEANNYSVSVTNLPGGIYFIKARGGSLDAGRKIIVNK